MASKSAVDKRYDSPYSHLIKVVMSIQVPTQLLEHPVIGKVFPNVEVAPLDLTDDVYGRLVRAIVFQQLSGKAAGTIYGRFAALFPDEYPEPELVLGFDLPSLRAVGLSKQKATYIQNVAGHFLENGLHKTNWQEYGDEEIIAQLTQIKGVGAWTVQMILIFALGRPDVLPTEDLAIQKAVQQLYNIEAKGRQLKTAMLEVAEEWRPYRSIVTRYLWRWLDISTPDS